MTQRTKANEPLIGRLAMTYDVRNSAPGMMVGADRPVVVCAKCGRPGILSRMVRCKDGQHRRIGHVLQFYLRGSESFCEYTELCTEPAPLAANDNDTQTSYAS